MNDVDGLEPEEDEIVVEMMSRECGVEPAKGLNVCADRRLAGARGCGWRRVPVSVGLCWMGVESWSCELSC